MTPELQKLIAELRGKTKSVLDGYVDHQSPEPTITWLHISLGQRAADTITTLRKEVERLGGLVYAPGRWKCVKCNFTLLQSNLNATTGNVTARDEAGDICPNCNSPLWRVSWKAKAQENQTIAETQFDRAGKAEADRDAVIARVEKAEAALAKVREHITDITNIVCKSHTINRGGKYIMLEPAKFEDWRASLTEEE